MKRLTNRYIRTLDDQQLVELFLKRMNQVDFSRGNKWLRADRERLWNEIVRRNVHYRLGKTRWDLCRQCTVHQFSEWEKHRRQERILEYLESWKAGKLKSFFSRGDANHFVFCGLFKDPPEDCPFLLEHLMESEVC